MSYLDNKEVLITPVEGQRIIRNCSKCGGKSVYINTENFRVNANGNSVDVWLIYQCEKCKTTYNLSVYERVKPKSIAREDYEKYMNNDKELAWRVSYTQSILKTNHVEVDTSSGSYRLIVEEERIVEESQGLTEAREICIKNPYQLRIRFDRILSEVLGLSRTEVKLKYDNGDIIMRVDNDSKDNCRTKKETIMNTFNINKAYVCKQAVFEVNDKLI